MKKLLAAGALLLASSQAFAGIISVTETASFGTQGSFTDVTIGEGLNETLTINAFDSALGRLTGVSIDVFSQIDTKGNSQNISDGPAVSTFRLTLDEDWAVSSSVFNHTFESARRIFKVEESNHLAGTTFDYGQLTTYKTGSFDASDLSAFTSNIDFTFVVDAYGGFSNTASVADAEFINTSFSAAWGQVEVTYTYDDTPHGPVPVPAPTSIAILGLGLAGFAFSRRNKKSA